MAKKQQSKGNGAVIGAAAVAVAAAAAGAYFLYGAKDAKKNRQMVKGWALKAKGEVLEGIEKIKDNLTEESYYNIVDGVVNKYASLKSASKQESDDLRKELRGHWKNIKKHFTLKTIDTTKTVAKKRSKKSS